MTTPGGLIATLISAKTAVAQAVDTFFNKVSLLLNGENSAFSATTNTNSGNIFDSSVNGFQLTPTGTTSTGTFSPFNENNWSVFFSGGSTSTAPYITSSSTSITNFGTGNFTIEVWAYPTAVGNGTYGSNILDTRAANTANTNVINFGLNPSNQVTVTNLVTTFVTTTTVLPYNAWTHIAISRWGTGTNQTGLFINGSLYGTYTDATSYGQAGFFVGTSANALNLAPFVGNLSSMRIVKGTALYQSSFVPATTTLPAVPGTTFLGLSTPTLIDSSPLGIPMASTNAPIVDNFGPFNNYCTNFNYSQSFNGSTDYAVIASSPSLQVGTNDFTLECWFNLSTLPATGGLSNGVAIFQKGRSGTSNLEWGLYIVNNSGVYSFVLQRSPDGGTTIDNLTSNSFTLAANTWVHVAISKYTVSTLGTVNWFVNGVFNKTSTFLSGSTIYAGAGAAGIAANNAGVAPLLGGLISNLRIVNGTSLYTSTSNFTPSTTPLTAIANTVLLTCNSSTIADQSPYNNTFTSVIGTPKLVAISPFDSNLTSSRNPPYNSIAPSTTQIPQGSIYFNGSSYYTTPSNTSYAVGTGSFTMEAWVYPLANAAMGVLATGSGASANPYLYINGLTPTLYYNGGAQATSATVTLNAWNHIAVVRNGTSVTVYTNGVGGTPVTLSTSLTQAGLTIGVSSTATQIFSGYISDVRFVNGTAVYTSNFTPSTSPLLAISNTKFLSLQANGAIDNSSSPALMTKAGAPVQVYMSPAGNRSASGTITGATRFGGTDYYTTPSKSAFIPAGDFTFETWLYANNNPANGPGTIIDTRSSASTTPWVVRVLNNLTVDFYTGTDNFSTGKIQLNSWNHLAIVRSGTTITFWINGANAGSFTQSGSLGSASTVLLGTNRTAGYPWYGYLWNTRLVTGTAVYTSAFTPSTSLTAISGTQLLTFQEQGAIDASSNLFTLTKTGTPNQTALVPSATNWSNSFNGTTDYFTVPANAAYNFGSNNFTIEMWAYFNSVSSTQVLLQQAASASSYWNFNIGNGTSSGAVFAYNSGAGQVIPLSEGNQTAWAANTWYHIALVRNGNTLTAYRNGSAIATGTLSGALYNPSSIMTVGAALTTANLNGFISNLRVVNGTAVYTGNFTPPTSALTAITNTVLLAAQSNKFVDNSSTAAVITTAGTPKTIPYSPFSTSTSTAGLNSGSYYFDGASYISTGYQTDAFRFPGNFTIEGWIYPTAVATYKVIFDSRTSGTSTTGIGVCLNASSQLVVYANNAAGIAAGTVPLNAWSHIAVVRNGTTITAYLNGVSVGTVTNSASQTDGNCVVGSANVAGNYFSGYISNLNVSNTSAKYITNFVPTNQPLAPTMTSSLLLSGTGTPVLDASAKANMFFVGNAQIVNGNAKYGNGSLLLPGSSYISMPTRPEMTFGFSNFTVEFWWRANTAVTQTNYAAVFSNNFGGGTPASGSWSLKIRTTTDNVQFSYSNGASLTNIDASASINVNNGSWHHIALSRSGTSIYIFVDGILQTSGSTIGSGQTIGISSANTFIGYQPRDGAYVNGWMDDIRVTNGYARYTSNFAPPTTLLPTN